MSTAFVLILAAIALLTIAGVVAALFGRSPAVALTANSAVAGVACGIGLVGSVMALLRHEELVVAEIWRLPVGAVRLGIDPLSAFFLLCVFLVAGLGVVYGAGYLRPADEAQHKPHGKPDADAPKENNAAKAGHAPSRPRRSLGSAALFLNLLVASLVLILLARDVILFLVAWEAMTVTSFFLVTYESERDEVRRAGLVYLIASQVGVVFLFVAFGLLAEHAGSSDFAVIMTSGAPAHAGVCFLFALIGFGTKAGLWPVHIWLPEAHPAAPSHVSAVMSGVMIKMGIYGLLRMLPMLGPPPPLWGFALLAVGAVSGLLGVLHALVQHDLKRLLAYCSVENVGVIALGVGLGLLGQSYGQPAVAVAGYAGALLHTLNHGIFKGLLFQGAGAVLHATGSRNIDHFGGLFLRMPATALTFLIGAVAISGLPPFNGFISEWLIYVGAFSAAGSMPTVPAALVTCVIPAVALIGGIAAAAFAKAFGVVFLGEPRTAVVHSAHEGSASMRFAMAIGAVLCLLIGLWPQMAIELVIEPARRLAQATAAIPFVAPLTSISRVALVVIAIAGLLVLLRSFLLSRRDVRVAPTWGCGYEAPSARMQYTGGSFAEPLLVPFAALVHRRVNHDGPEGYFPKAARYEDHLGDVAGERVLAPAARRIVSALGRLRIIQHGRTQLYLAYVLVTLIALLFWQLGFLGLR